MMALDQGVLSIMTEAVGPVPHENEGTDGRMWHRHGNTLPVLEVAESVEANLPQWSGIFILAKSPQGSEPHPERIKNSLSATGAAEVGPTYFTHL